MSTYKPIFEIFNYRYTFIGKYIFTRDSINKVFTWEFSKKKRKTWNKNCKKLTISVIYFAQKLSKSIEILMTCMQFRFTLSNDSWVKCRCKSNVTLSCKMSENSSYCTKITPIYQSFSSTLLTERIIILA